MNLLSIGVIVTYIVILFYYIKDDDYTKMLGLTLVKYKYDTEIDDFTKYFKSVIINQKTNKMHNAFSM